MFLHVKLDIILLLCKSTQNCNTLSLLLGLRRKLTLLLVVFCSCQRFFDLLICLLAYCPTFQPLLIILCFTVMSFNICNLWPHCLWPAEGLAASQLVTWSTHHTVNSSYSQLVTVNSSHDQLVTWSSRHIVLVNSSHSHRQLATSWHTQANWLDTFLVTLTD